MKLRLAGVALAAAAASGCATAAAKPAPLALVPPPAVVPLPAPEGEPWREEGVASWYGPGFHGKQTANGETFDTHADMTAAHRRLPFGTRVRVTRLDTGRSVVVRVNDRGPFAKGRIIDLSSRAARELAMIDSGTARVRVESLAPVGRKGMKETDAWTVQAGAFQDREAAFRVRSALDDRFRPVAVERTDEGLYRVRAGAFDTKEEALAAAEEIQDLGLESLALPAFP